MTEWNWQISSCLVMSQVETCALPSTNYNLKDQWTQVFFNGAWHCGWVRSRWRKCHVIVERATLLRAGCSLDFLGKDWECQPLTTATTWAPSPRPSIRQWPSWEAWILSVPRVSWDLWSYWRRWIAMELDYIIHYHTISPLEITGIYWLRMTEDWLRIIDRNIMEYCHWHKAVCG